MDIKSLIADGGQSSPLSELLKKERSGLVAEQTQASAAAQLASAGEEAAPAVVAQTLDVVEISSKNVMSRNFAGESEGQSRYLKAALSGFSAKKQIDNRFFGMVASLKATMNVELEKAGEYNAGSTIYRVSKRAGAMLEQDKQEEVNKGAKVHLDKSREDIEEATTPAELLEGAAPAETAEVFTGGGGEGAPEAPVPEVSTGQGAASAPEVSIDVVV